MTVHVCCKALIILTKTWHHYLLENMTTIYWIGENMTALSIKTAENTICRYKWQLCPVKNMTPVSPDKHDTTMTMFVGSSSLKHDRAICRYRRQIFSRVQIPTPHLYPSPYTITFSAFFSSKLFALTLCFYADLH